MVLDAIRLIIGPLLAAIIGGFVVHIATRRRDAENERRKQRISYLLDAYRSLAQSANRDMSDDQKEKFENALADVVLLGNAEQIRLARDVGAGLAGGGAASLDDLLVSFRKALRAELGLENDALTKVPLLRFSETSTETPLRVDEPWSVKLNETKSAISAASSKYQSVPDADLASQDRELRALARTAPGAAVQNAYGQIRSALIELLNSTETDKRDVPSLAAQAARQGLITTESVNAIQGLAVMKNLSHRDGSGTGLTPKRANEFLDLVEAMLYVIGRPKPDSSLNKPGPP